MRTQDCPIVIFRFFVLEAQFYEFWEVFGNFDLN